MSNLFIYHLSLTQEYNNPDKWNDETYHLIKLHFNFLTALKKRGILILAGRTNYEPGHENLFGIALFKAPSLEIAKEIMLPDPAVIHNIQKASIYPFLLAIDNFKNINK